jgi:Holliday junction resolvasome RuvABC endonuclease subunit
MKIVGLDCSPSSTGCIKMHLDDKLNIIEIEKMGFLEISKTSKASYTDIHTYKETDFKTFYHRLAFMVPKIIEFCSDAEYVACEDYAFSAKGKITMLAELAGNLKYQLFQAGKNLRFYDPTSIKMYGTTKGNAKKPDMFDGYCQLPYKIDLSYLPQIPFHKKGKNAGLRNKDGISPLSDLIDAFFICDMLRHEIGYKDGSKTVSNVSTACNKIMLRTTKTTKLSLKDQPFIKK